MPDTTAKDVSLTEQGDQTGERPFSQDLNPDFLKGQNAGMQGPRAEQNAPTAHDVKAAHNSLIGFEDNELKQIPILPQGSRLDQGATYIDLHESPPREFKATGDMEAGPDNWYVPKKTVPYELWNRLIGIDNPERLDQADDL